MIGQIDPTIPGTPAAIAAAARRSQGYAQLAGNMAFIQTGAAAPTMNTPPRTVADLTESMPGLVIEDNEGVRERETGEQQPGDVGGAPIADNGGARESENETVSEPDTDECDSGEESETQELEPAEPETHEARQAREALERRRVEILLREAQQELEETMGLQEYAERRVLEVGEVLQPHGGDPPADVTARYLALGRAQVAVYDTQVTRQATTAAASVIHDQLSYESLQALDLGLGEEDFLQFWSYVVQGFRDEARRNWNLTTFIDMERARVWALVAGPDKESQDAKVRRV